MRALATGLAAQLAGTLLIRLAGQYLLHPGDIGWSIGLYAVSFVLMALLIRVLGVGRESVSLLILPTLLLDPFTCLFFARVFPNVDPAAAATFGGWMLISCAGGVAGAWLKR
jgi:hypothetical protein